MARTKAIEDSMGFTTDYFGRCAICKEPIPELHLTCKCGALIMRVNPQPKQRQLIDMALAAGDNVPTRLLYGGARAAGKSRGARDLALIVASEMSQLYPGLTICIMRRNWTQCEDTHLLKLKQERPELTQFYTNKKYEFPVAMGGPIIAFQYADSPADVERMERGPEWFLMLVDQAEQISGLDLQRIKSPNRWAGAQPGAAKTIYLYNPGGTGTEYLKRVGYDKIYLPELNEEASDFAFLQAFGWDNIHWFMNHNIEIDGAPLDWDTFYSLPGECPALSPRGKHDSEWLETIADNERFKLFVTKTTEGKSHWKKPESLRMGDLFGRFDAFAGQAFAGVWNRDRAVIR